MADPRPHSGLIVEIPEAEPAVARHRERLDASARLGIPAHITVLFPFMPPQAIGPAALTGLEHLFGPLVCPGSLLWLVGEFRLLMPGWRDLVLSCQRASSWPAQRVPRVAAPAGRLRKWP